MLGSGYVLGLGLGSVRCYGQGNLGLGFELGLV